MYFRKTAHSRRKLMENPQKFDTMICSTWGTKNNFWKIWTGWRCEVSQVIAKILFLQPHESTYLDLKSCEWFFLIFCLCKYLDYYFRCVEYQKNLTLAFWEKSTNVKTMHFFTIFSEIANFRKLQELKSHKSSSECSSSQCT